MMDMKQYLTYFPEDIVRNVRTMRRDFRIFAEYDDLLGLSATFRVKGNKNQYVVSAIREESGNHLWSIQENLEDGTVNMIAHNRTYTTIHNRIKCICARYNCRTIKEF